eukprot:jgi/Mesvir1/15353/Mv26326-RA.1
MVIKDIFGKNGDDEYILMGLHSARVSLLLALLNTRQPVSVHPDVYSLEEHAVVERLLRSEVAKGHTNTSSVVGPRVLWSSIQILRRWVLW